MDPRCTFYCSGKGDKREMKKDTENGDAEKKPKIQSNLKCYKAGAITRNPFFNFLRTIRQEQCGMSIIDVAKEGAARWKMMNDQQKCKFYMEAYRAVRRKRKAKRLPLAKKHDKKSMKRTAQRPQRQMKMIKKEA